TNLAANSVRQYGSRIVQPSKPAIRPQLLHEHHADYHFLFVFHHLDHEDRLRFHDSRICGPGLQAVLRLEVHRSDAGSEACPELVEWTPRRTGSNARQFRLFKDIPRNLVFLPRFSRSRQHQNPYRELLDPKPPTGGILSEGVLAVVEGAGPIVDEF